MDLRGIPRAAVDGYIQLLRVPLGGALRMIGKDGTALDRRDAPVGEAPAGEAAEERGGEPEDI